MQQNNQYQVKACFNTLRYTFTAHYSRRKYRAKSGNDSVYAYQRKETMCNKKNDLFVSTQPKLKEYGSYYKNK